jgi:predicted nucleotidyltransferase
MSDTSIELHPAIAQLVNDLSLLPYVESILLFGSRARRDGHSRSDVDLAIDCPQASTNDWQTILDQVEQAETLLPIDCIRLDEAEPALRENILKWNKVLYERK